MEKVLNNELMFDEMESAEELGDGWFLAGAGCGIVAGAVVWAIVT